MKQILDSNLTFEPLGISHPLMSAWWQFDQLNVSQVKVFQSALLPPTPTPTQPRANHSNKPLTLMVSYAN